MAGFLKRLFGGKDKHSVDVAGRTKRTGRLAVTGKHVQTLQSLGTSKPRGSEEPDTDTGPWYIGKTVADIFEIRGVLGRGGMGTVYQAHDNATQRKVAVKVPLGKFVDDEDAKKRFTREAEAWTGLIHPHIVHAFDVRDDQSTDYRPAIFMDYCDGGSLSDSIYNGQLPSTTEALDIAIQICWAMEFAHEKDHIHRDLKPANVLLISDGKALVTDFGLVKMLDVEDLDLEAGKLSRADAQVLASISQAGGTPEYMPLEQWESKAEKASDIYAFGVMLYELFCGCRPFTGQSLIALRTAHMQVPAPDPQQLNRDIPAALAEIMLSCLAKRPCDRPRNFCDLADKLLKTYTVAAINENMPLQYVRNKPQECDISRADKKVRAGALLRLGDGCRLRGDLTDTRRHCTQSLALFRELDDKAGMGWCYNHMGIVASGCGECDEAMELYRKALALFRGLDDTVGVGACCMNMGSVADELGQYTEAIRLYRKYLAICEELGDKKGMANSYNCMGVVAYRRGRYNKAMKLYRKSLTICEELGDKVGIGMCYRNMGLVADDHRERYDEAIRLYRKHLAICEELGDKKGMAACYRNMGRVAVGRREYDEAMELYHKSLAICEELGDKAQMGGVYWNMAALARRTGDDREMCAHAREVVRLLDEVGIPLDKWLRKAARM